MKSRTSFFNLALLRKNITRFSPIWICYLAFGLLILPIYLGTRVADRWEMQTWYDVAQYICDLTAGAGPSVALVYGLVIAMAVFSYLYTARSVSMLHSLPIRRSGLFLTNYVSGLLFILVPNALIALLTLLVTSFAGVAAPGMTFTMFWVLSGMEFFFYSFATFIAMFTGHILALPVFYGIYNCVLAVLYAAIYAFIGQFMYGVSIQSTFFERICVWATPVVNLYAALTERTEYTKISNVDGTFYYGDPALSVTLEGCETVLVYIVIGILLAILSYVAYRHRHSESAGDVVSVGWAKVVFRYGVGITAAFTIGQGLYWVLFNDTDNIVLEVVCMILAAAVGFAVAQMLLNKSFRVLRKSLKGSAVCAVLILVILAMAVFDITGATRRVPDADRVESVDVTVNAYDYSNATLREAENIEAVVALHQTIVDQRSELYTTDWYFDEGKKITTTINLAYRMEDGSILSRNYTLVLQKDSELTALTERVVNSPEYQTSYWLNDSMDETYEPWSAVFSWYEEGEYDITQEKKLSGAQLEKVYAALEEDGAASRLQKIDLLGKDADDSYANYLEICYVNENGSDRYRYITISKDMTATIAALEDSGVLDDRVKLVERSVVDAYWNDEKYVDVLEGESTVVEDSVEIVATETQTNPVVTGVQPL